MEGGRDCTLYCGAARSYAVIDRANGEVFIPLENFLARKSGPPTPPERVAAWKAQHNRCDDRDLLQWLRRCPEARVLFDDMSNLPSLYALQDVVELSPRSVFLLGLKPFLHEKNEEENVLLEHETPPPSISPPPPAPAQRKVTEKKKKRAPKKRQREDDALSFNTVLLKHSVEQGLKDGLASVVEDLLEDAVEAAVVKVLGGQLEAIVGAVQKALKTENTEENKKQWKREYVDRNRDQWEAEFKQLILSQVNQMLKK